MDENSLASVLGEFAQTMLTGVGIQAMLDRLVERIVEVLPVTGAGVSLISPGTAPQYVAASSAAALRVEQLQTELCEGPCVAAYESGAAVVVPDLATDASFPAFAVAALAAGTAAVFAFPLRHDRSRLGALDLYRDTPGALDAGQMAAAETLADVAAAYLVNAQAREHALAAHDRFRHSALHDALTGLPNRVLLGQRLEHAAARARRSHSTSAVLFADLDHFKRVNDTYGHAVGDELLASVAGRLSMLVRPGDTLARVSGDEFVIVCEDLAGPGDAELLAVRIDRAFAAPFTVAGMELSVTASVGIAYAGPGRGISYQLVTDADSAMYEAKRRGRAHHVIDLRDAAHCPRGTDLAGDLRTAVTAGALGVAYQPVVRTTDGLVTGVQTLLRWHHPVLGLVPARTTVAVAESDGLINDVGAWVLERGCHDHRAWRSEHPHQPLELSVNVSARQLIAGGFADVVAGVLDAAGMHPPSLVLELTESTLLAEREHAAGVLADLRAMGVRLALGGFGTGDCSLSSLRRFPVDIIKIDRGFTAAAAREHVAAAIVTAVAQLGHGLGMTVIADGVDTPEQHDRLAGSGCQYAQGLLYAQPMTSGQVRERLADDPWQLPRLPHITGVPHPVPEHPPTSARQVPGAPDTAP